MCSLVSVLPGPWLPCIGGRMVQSSMSNREGDGKKIEGSNGFTQVIPTTTSTHYHYSLGFSVAVFCSEALIAILILLIRRNPAVGGELGGPKSVKTVTSSIFVCLWLFYVLVSALEAYKVIDPGF